MCGIVGYVGSESCTSVLVDGLKRLEYRGYDSAGIAAIDGSEIRITRSVGKLVELEKALRATPVDGMVGIGHTRWATHGRPSEVNAHPHRVGDVVVVHNGIIENYLKLRADLLDRGATIESDTDTELIAHLIAYAHSACSLEDAVAQVTSELDGAYAIAVLSAKENDKIVVAKKSSPLVLGIGEGATYCASDVAAILSHTRDMIFLEDGELAVLKKEVIKLRTLAGEVVERAPKRIDWSPAMAEKGGYKHFMLKEIFEQPRSLEDTLRGRIDRDSWTIFDDEVGLNDEELKTIDRVTILACGTSHHAGLVGRYYIEALGGLPTAVELASEFRGRKTAVGPRDLVVAISQSGETLDTLMATKEAKARGATVLAIANVIGSAIPRHADGAFYTHAGPEIGVASTKCFIAQLANLLMLSVKLGRAHDYLRQDEAKDILESMVHLPALIENILSTAHDRVERIARKYLDARDVLFLGRGPNFPIALEGALKLKEISYVHAEGYAAGEMKHGPIALLDSNVPVIVLAPSDSHHARCLSNVQEAKARDAMVIAIVTRGDTTANEYADDNIEIPEAREELYPFLTVVPLQLYAYYVADHKGTDVDQPRNLAKTVTVE